jgi:hypothetical protein
MDFDGKMVERRLGRKSAFCFLLGVRIVVFPMPQPLKWLGCVYRKVPVQLCETPQLVCTSAVPALVETASAYQLASLEMRLPNEKQLSSRVISRI